MARSFSEIYTEEINEILQHYPMRTSPPHIHTHVTEKKYMDLLESYNDLRESYVKNAQELINCIGGLEGAIYSQNKRHNKLLELIKTSHQLLDEKNEIIDKLRSKLNSGFLSRLFS